MSMVDSDVFIEDTTISNNGKAAISVDSSSLLLLAHCELLSNGDQVAIRGLQDNATVFCVHCSSDLTLPATTTLPLRSQQSLKRHLSSDEDNDDDFGEGLSEMEY